MALDAYKPYKAKDTAAPLPEYDAMRKKLEQRSNADVQTQQDAMQRRFAAQGGLNSGAAIKQQQLIAETGAQNREQGIEGINNQETAEKRRLAEIETGREFQSNEALAGRQFAAGESQLGRDFTAGESRTGREFAAGESKLGRDFTAGQSREQMAFAAGESKLGRDQAMQIHSDTLDFQKKAQAFTESNAGKQLELAVQQLNQAKNESNQNNLNNLVGLDADELRRMGTPEAIAMANKRDAEQHWYNF